MTFLSGYPKRTITTANTDSKLQMKVTLKTVTNQNSVVQVKVKKVQMISNNDANTFTCSKTVAGTTSDLPCSFLS